MANTTNLRSARRDRVRRRLRRRNTGRLRLSVFRSSKNIYVQVIDDAEGKTKALAGQLAKAGFGKKVLVIDGEAVNDNFARAARNIVGVNVLPAQGANVYDILKHDTLVLTRAAVEKLEARFNG